MDTSVMDLATAEWVVAIVVLVVFAAAVYGLIGVVSRGRIMRCPETDSVTFVQTALAVGKDGKASEPVVEHCDLWPERNGCARGCLARYRETSDGYRVDPDALRPFKPQ